MTIERASCYDVPELHRMQYEEQITDQAKNTGKEGDKKVKGFSDGFMPELFHRLYSMSPNEIENPPAAAAMRKKVHDLISELPEFETLRTQTVRDPIWSAMGTDALSQSVVKVLPDAPKDVDADEAQRVLEGLQTLQDQGINISPEEMEAARKAAEAAAKAMQDQANNINESQVRSAARQALNEAQEQIDETQQALASFGYGAGSTAFKNPKVALHLARKIASSPNLKRVAEMAGRLRAIARAKRSRRVDYARSEMVGVEQTKDFSRLVPTEMTYMASAHTTPVVLKRLVEGTATGYRLRGKTQVGKGPIVVALDQSGSMSGDKDCWAKGIALALLDAARADNRAFGVILYDGRVQHQMLVEDPLKVGPEELLNLLSTFTGGGTDFAPPMQLARKWISEAPKFSKADIVHITDGDADTDHIGFKAWAEESDVSVFGIGIGVYNSSSLQSWCTEPIVAINDVKNDTEAVNLIFDNI